jgi:hypothetical protein
MRDEMTIEDATNVVNVLGDVLACDANGDARELGTAARRLLRHITEQSSELERERARRRGLARGEVRVPDGNPLKEGADGGGRRDFLAARPVHAGEALFLLTCAGWHPVRYESNFPAREPVLYLPVPGVWQDVVIGVPRDARFAWPEEFR